LNFVLRNPEKKRFPQNIKQQNCFHNNKKEAPNQHIRLISEGSCDTEDWSNDAEYSALLSQEQITF